MELYESLCYVHACLFHDMFCPTILDSRDLYHTSHVGLRFIRHEWSFSQCAKNVHDLQSLWDCIRGPDAVVAAVFRQVQISAFAILKLFHFGCAYCKTNASLQNFVARDVNENKHLELEHECRPPHALTNSNFVNVCQACGFTKTRMFIINAHPGQALIECTSADTGFYMHALQLSIAFLAYMYKNINEKSKLAQFHLHSLLRFSKQ